MAELIKEFTTELGSGICPDGNTITNSFWYTAPGFAFNGRGISRGHKLYHIQAEGEPGIDGVVLYTGGSAATNGYSINRSYQDISSGTGDAQNGGGSSWSMPFIRNLHTQSINGVQTAFIGMYERLLRYRVSDGILDVSQHSGGAYFGSYLEQTLWTFMPWGSWVVATNGQDAPQLYQGTTFTDLAGFETIGSCEIMIDRSPFAIAMNLANYPNDIAWCSDDDINTWNATASNSAGRLTARGMSSPIRAAARNGTTIAFAGDDEVRTLDYTNDSLVFGINPRVTGIGANSKHSICWAGGMLYGSGPGGIWRSDLSNKEYIDEGWVKELVEANYIRTRRWECTTFDDAPASTVWFYFPNSVTYIGNSTGTFGVGFNYRTNSWVQGVSAVVGAAPAGVWDYPIIGAATYFALQSGITSDTTYTTLARLIQFLNTAYSCSLDLGYPDNTKFISEIEVDLTVPTGSPGDFVGTNTTMATIPQASLTSIPDKLYISVFYKINEQDDWSIVSFPASTNFFKQNGKLVSRFPLGITGRFFIIQLAELNTSTTNLPWQINKIRFFGEVMGETR